MCCACGLGVGGASFSVGNHTVRAVRAVRGEFFATEDGYRWSGSVFFGGRLQLWLIQMIQYSPNKHMFFFSFSAWCFVFSPVCLWKRTGSCTASVVKTPEQGAA